MTSIKTVISVPAVLLAYTGKPYPVLIKFMGVRPTKRLQRTAIITPDTYTAWNRLAFRKRIVSPMTGWNTIQLSIYVAIAVVTSTLVVSNISCIGAKQRLAKHI